MSVPPQVNRLAAGGDGIAVWIRAGLHVRWQGGPAVEEPRGAAGYWPDEAVGGGLGSKRFTRVSKVVRRKFWRGMWDYRKEGTHLGWRHPLE